MKHQKISILSIGVLLVIGSLFMISCAETNRKNTEESPVKSLDSADNLNQQKFVDNHGDLQAARYLSKVYANSLFSTQLSKNVLKMNPGNSTRSTALYLIDVHQSFNKNLKGIAERMGASLPRKMSNEQAKDLDRIKNNNQYEQTYLRKVFAAHQKSLRIIKEAKNSSNTVVQKWANENLSLMKTMIDSIQSAEKKIDSLK